MTLILALVVKATLLLLAAFAADAMLGRRHVLLCAAMWNAVLVALLALPLAAVALPGLSLPLLPPVLVPAVGEMASTAMPQPTISVPEVAPFEQISVVVHATQPGRLSAATILVSLYFLGVVACVIRLAVAWIAASRLRTAAAAVGCPEWQERLTHWRRCLGCRQVELCQSTDVRVPLLVGCVCPTILLPSQMAADLEGPARDAVLVHELAHVLRRDFAWQLVLRVVQAALWFHPLIWLAERRIHLIRERACDDFSIHTLGSNQQYAGVLLAIASRLIGRPTLALGLAMTRTPQIAARIAAIATSTGNARCRMSARGGAGAIAFCLLGTGLIGSIMVVRAQPPQAAAGQTNSAPRTRQMHIRVLDSDNRPLAGAKVFANVTLVDPVRINNREYTCDPAGQVILELPAEPIDMFRLWADCDGHVGWHAHWWPKYQADGHLLPDDYTFRLEKGTTIGGLVKDEAGQPIAGAKVEVMRRDPAAAEVKVRAFRSLYLAGLDSRHDTRRTTDAEGRWTLNNVPAGDDVELLLKVSHSDYTSDHDWGEMQKRQGITIKSLRDRAATIVMVRAPKAGASPAAAQASRAADQPPAAPSESPGVVSGQVVLAESGAPVAGATVFFRDGYLRRTTSDDMGRFRFEGIPAGQYRVWAVKDTRTSSKEPLIGQPSSTDALPQFSPLRLPLRVGKQITVTVTSAASRQPVAGAKVELEFPDRQRQTTAQDGTALLQALLPQRYRLTVQAESFARELRELDLSTTVDQSSLSVALAPGGTLCGIVTDENQVPLAHADIAFRTNESPVGFYGESPYTDDQGRYRSLYLPRNTPIRVFVGMKDYLSEQQDVTLTGQQTDLELNFHLKKRPSGGSVSGIVTDKDGQPIAGASVVNFGNATNDRRETTTDQAGRFALHDLVKNHIGYELVLRAPGFVPAQQKTEPGPAQNPTAVRVQLEKGHSLRARVQNTAGQPVSGAYIDVNGGAYPGKAGESLRSDARGEFTSNSLPLGSTFRIYADGYSTLDKATPPLDQDQTVVLTLEPTGVIRGQVTDAATGAPVHQFRIRLGSSADLRPGEISGTYRSELGEPGQTFQSADGAFTVHELTSRMPFKVIVEADGYEPLTLPRVVADPEATAAAVHAPLKKREPINPAVLSGQVIDHKGDPLGSVQLRLIVSTSPSNGDNDNRFNWTLIETGQLGKKDYVEQYLSAVTGDDGKFELKELLPGKFLQIAYWGPRAPKGRTLALAKTKPGASQSVTIQLPELATIRGSFDADAFADASRMSLTLQGQSFLRYELVLANGKSNFAFENLAPGKYWLSVVGQPKRHADDPQMFSHPNLASRLLTVEPGQALEVRLTKDDQVKGAKR